MSWKQSAVLALAVIAAAIWIGFRVTPGRGEVPAAHQSVYQLAASAHGLIAWRLNNQTGEIIACRAAGATGRTSSLFDGATCWTVHAAAIPILNQVSPDQPAK